MPPKTATETSAETSTVTPAAYRVQPNGYDQFPEVFKNTLCLFVVDGGTHYGWAIRVSSMSSSVILTRHGEQKYDNRRFRRHYRFPLDKALEIAREHVNTVEFNGRTAAQALTMYAQRSHDRDAANQPAER